MPPPTLDTVGLWLEDPHADSAKADSTDSGISPMNRVIGFLSGRV